MQSLSIFNSLQGLDSHTINLFQTLLVERARLEIFCSTGDVNVCTTGMRIAECAYNTTFRLLLASFLSRSTLRSRLV